MLWWNLIQLKSKEASKCERAILKLAEAKSPRAVNALIRVMLEDSPEILRDEDFNSFAAFVNYVHRLRCLSALALGQIGDPRAIPPLVQAGRSRGISDAVGEALKHFRGPNAVKPLLDALRCGNSSIGLGAAAGLANNGDLARQDLLNLLKDEDRKVSLLAAMSLGMMGDPRSIEPLIAALRYINEAGAPLDCNNVSDVLIFTQNPAALEPLGRLLRDHQKHVRFRAAHTLGGFRHPRAVEILSQALGRKDDSMFVTDAVVRALGRIGDAPAIEALLAAADKVPQAAKTLDQISPDWRANRPH